jgi:Flp pilus assembly pilin Flp
MAALLKMMIHNEMGQTTIEYGLLMGCFAAALVSFLLMYKNPLKGIYHWENEVISGATNVVLAD